jgi:hypothetical protein
MTAVILILSILPQKDYTKHSIHNVCWSVTNFWPFTEQDGQWIHTPWNGQADGDPFHTAYMVPITPEMGGTFVAAPYILRGARLHLPGWGLLPVWDRFGKAAYDRGVFYHHTYGQHVLAVDVFTPVPLHYLECDGEIER